MWRLANIISLSVLFIATIVSVAIVSLTHHSSRPFFPNPSLHRGLTTPDLITIQTATHCTRDLWVADKHHRFQTHIDTPSTRLILQSSQGNTTLLEEMDSIKLWSQDRFTSFPKMQQQIRFLQAKKGSLDLTSTYLHTQESFIALYTTPGSRLYTHLKPANILMEATADTFDLTLGKQGIDISAEGFTAQVKDRMEEPL